MELSASIEIQDVPLSVPELVARGVICQMFPLHEQRILGQLMTSWVQAVCEKQPLGNVCTAACWSTPAQRLDHSPVGAFLQ